jgi:hypothetical protein
VVIKHAVIEDERGLVVGGINLIRSNAAEPGHYEWWVGELRRLANTFEEAVAAAFAVVRAKT